MFSQTKDLSVSINDEENFQVHGDCNRNCVLRTATKVYRIFISVNYAATTYYILF